MPDIYTPSWYEEVKEAMNESASRLTGVPDGSFVVAIEIGGDGMSPYVDISGLRRFLIKIDQGKCQWYREIASKEEETELSNGGVNFRFTGPATTFDEIAAGLLDPIDAALKGLVKVRGDMRFLMRHSEHVKALLDAYSRNVITLWPQGMPPYGVSIQPEGRETSSNISTSEITNA